MHFHAEHSLFFEQRQPVWYSAASLALVVAVLLVNSAAGSASLSLLGSGVALVLLAYAYTRGQRRAEPVLAWLLLLTTSVLLVGAILGGDQSLLLETAARVSCGVLWVLWLGTQLDWGSLRQLLLFLRVPWAVVSTLDHALMNGVLTKDEWGRRRDAVRLRLGSPRLSLTSWGRLLGEGALSGFLRLESVEENALLRGARSAALPQSEDLRLEEVSLLREGQAVLNQLSLAVSPGECVLLCGPSGAGKSSILRLIAGLDAPSSGSVSRMGLEFSSEALLKHRLDGRVGLLCQNPEHHFIASTVAEDIAWGLVQRGVESSEVDRRCNEVATSLGLKNLLNRPCHALSFGEQRRVALAGVLVLEPKLLLLDEPTSGLDPVAAYQLRNLVASSVAKTGAACLWATHDLNSVPEIAGRVVLLRNGEVVFDGKTSEGLSEPWLLRAGLLVSLDGQS